MEWAEYDKAMADLDAEQRAIEARLVQIGEQRYRLVDYVITEREKLAKAKEAA